ncbi:MAG: hypothetical protein ACRD2J_13730 [Thermoanaerobaculia bacterium]
MRRARPDERPGLPEIVVATFASETEARDALDALRRGGIAATVSTIATARLSARGERETLRWGLTVAPADARRAIEVLQDTLRPGADPSLDLDLDEPLEIPREPLRCPECGSDQVKTTRTLTTAAAGTALLVLTGWATGYEDLFYLAAAIFALLLVLGPNQRCLRCGHRWME